MRGVFPRVQNLRAMTDWTAEWVAIRKGLREARINSKLTPEALATAIDASVSNVYRLENIADDPEQQPRLETIMRWLEKTTKEDVGVFLTRVRKAGQPPEKPNAPDEKEFVTSPDTVEVEDQSHPPTYLDVAGTPRDGAHGTRVSLEIPDLTHDEARLFQRLGLILIGAANAVFARTADEPAPADQSPAGPRRLNER